VTPASTRHADRPADGWSLRAAWLCLAACTAAAALLQLDGSLITVALPSVARGLRVSGALTSVLLSVYFAAYAIALLPGGVLVDRFGARRLALLGLTLFAFGAAAGAAASGIGWLVAARAVQGVGGGLVSPAALAGAVSGFAAERRGSALGVWGASAGMANLAGPLLGGLLTIALGWRADWWALVPLAALAALAIARLVPALPPDAERDRPAGLVRNPVVLAATLLAGLTFAVMIGAFYLAEQFLQRSAGYSALRASSVLVIVALLVGAAAPLAGTLSDRRGERAPATLGLLLAAGGLLVLGAWSVSLRSALTIAPLVPIGFGLGLLFVPTSRAALNATAQAHHGRASALLSVGRLSGAAVGAGLAGVAIAGGPSAATVRNALLLASALCLVVGLPAATRLRGTPSARPAPGLAVGEP